MAGERHERGTLCVNRPLELSSVYLSSDWSLARGPRCGTNPTLGPEAVRTGQFQPFVDTMQLALHFHICSTQHTGMSDPDFMIFWLSWSSL